MRRKFNFSLQFVQAIKLKKPIFLLNLTFFILNSNLIMKSFFHLFKNLAHPVGLIGTLFAVLIPFFIYLLPNVGQKEFIRNADLHFPIWLFIVQFIAIVSILIYLHKDLSEWIRSHFPSKRLFIAVIGFTVIATIFAGTQIEARHRVQSDESVFLSVAQNLYYNQSSGTCNQGEFQDSNLKCHVVSNSFKTKGQPFLYYLGMYLFGTDLQWIFSAQLLMFAATLLLFFLAVFVWTKEPILSFLSVILIAAQPTILFQFRSMSVEPLYFFLSALSILVLKWAHEKNTLIHWILLGLVLGFFAQTRQETIFCLFAFILFSLPKLLERKDEKAPAFFLTLSIFTLPALLTISFFQGYNFQGGEFNAHGHFLEHLISNWDVMTKPLQNGELVNPFLSYFNYLFLFGVFALVFSAVREWQKGKLGFSFYSLCFLLLYHIQTYAILENVSGDFSIEINQRYSVVMLPTMAFIAAFGIQFLISILLKATGTENKFSKATVSAVVILLSAIGFFGYTMSYKSSFNKNIMYNRNHLTIEEKNILTWLETEPAKKRLFIYGRPWHFIGYGISSVHYDFARSQNEAVLKKWIDDYDGEVYYVRGLDCWDSKTYHQKAVETRIPTTCDVFEREMQLEPVKNILITNNYWLQIAKFKGRKTYQYDQVLQVSPLTIDSTKKITVSYTQRHTQATPWQTRIYLNQTLLLQEPYTANTFSRTLENASPVPGYNTLEFFIVDTLKRENVAYHQTIFFDQNQGATKLTDLAVVSHRQDWGELKKNTTIEDNPFTTAGKKYTEGFGTHAASTTVFLLDKPYSKFTALVGLDDESLCSDGVQLILEGDDKPLYQSPTIESQKVISIETSLSNVKKLTLKTLSLQSRDCDHVNIIYPTLYE